MIVGMDMEWTRGGIDILGLSWDEGRKATATQCTEQSFKEFIDTLSKAELVVGQNLIDADFRQLESIGVDTSGFNVYDIRLAMHATHGHLSGTGSFDLRSIVLLLNGKKGIRFPLDWKEYASDLHRTCAMDAAAALWCYPTLDRQVKAHKLEGVLKVAHLVSPIFAMMQERGVKLDRTILETIHNERKRKLEENIERFGLWEERGKKVIKRVPIWRSPKVLDLFESKFGIRPANLQRQTWLKLASNPNLPEGARDFVDAIIELGRGANDAHWLGQVEETEDGLDFSKVDKDGYIYPRYDICGSPDRAIASGPNIQNFPRPSEDPRPTPLRRSVVPLDSSHSILGIDFSSLETITNAIESHDWDRVQATLEKRVSHEGTAALLNKAFGLHLNRNQGKVVNHGFDKGESPYNLARNIFKAEKPSRQQVLQCSQIFDKMLDQFPKTQEFRNDLWERSRDNPLVVTNSFGRRLLCFSRAKYGESRDFASKHNDAKKYWCSCSDCAPRRDRWKYAIAFLGRSAGFDALLRAMVRIWYEKRLDEFSLPYLEVHDELDFSVPTNKLEYYSKIAKEAFEEPIAELGGIKLPADVKHGASWAEAH